MASDTGQLRVGLIGLAFGYHHLRTLASRGDCRVVAVADRSSKGLDDAARQYGFTPYRDAIEMLDRESLDAVVLCISPKGRRPLIEKAVAKNVAMFIEKPWASNGEHARELAKLAEDSAAPVMVAFSFRFLPAMAKLKELVDGELGRVRLLSGQYVMNYLPPTDFWLWDDANGGGLFNENSCHLFDAVCHLMGRPTRVFAEGGRFADRPGEDAAAITLHFEGGGIATLAVGAIGTAGFEDFPRLDLHAEHGQAQLRGRNHIWTDLAWATDGPRQSIATTPEGIADTRYTNAFDHFFDCVREGKPTRAPIADGVLAVDIAMAVGDSIRTGHPVDL